MRCIPSKSSVQPYLLSLSLAIFLTASSFHILSIDTNAYACSCALPESAKDALDGSDAVFSGKVMNIDGKYPDHSMDSRHDPVSVTFAVDQVWKGPANSTMTINTESSEASCGYEFQQNETYVVYSYEKENEDHSTLHTGLCSGTSLLSESSYDLNELDTGTKTSQLGIETGKSKEENKIESIVLTSFDLYFEEDDFTAQGPNHNLLRLGKGESATLNIHIKNNDDVPHHITMMDPRGVATSGTFESFSFEPEQLMVLPHQTNSTNLHLTISNNTDTHSKFVTFLAQSDSFGMRGIGFFIVVDREIDEFVDHSMRSGMPGPAFGNLNTDILEIDAEKLIDSGFGTPRHLPSGYEFQGMDGSDGHQRFLYSPAPVIAESTGFSELWNDGGLLILYGIDGPNVNNTNSLPFRIAQDEGQQIMINGMMGDAVEKQTKKVAYSDTTYESPASISFFDDATKRSAHLKAVMPLEKLLSIASSIPIYDKPYFAAEENTVQQQGQVDYPPPRSSDIAPLKQLKSGIPVDEIQCKKSLVLVTKHDGSPACVKPETKEKLEQRGWTHPCPNAMFSEQRSLRITGSPEIGSELEPELQAISKNNILSKGTGFDLPEDTFTQEDLEHLQQRENELRKIRDNPDTPYEQRQSVSVEIRQMQDRLQYPFQTGVPYHLVKEIKERYAVLEDNLDDARKHVRFSVLNSDAISSEHHTLRIGIHPQSFGLAELKIQDKEVREYLGNEMNILYEAVSVIPN